MKILILGVGNAQEDAINYLKAEGHTVLGCSYTNTEKGIRLLDGFAQINITDVKAVCSYAKRQNIDAVYSVGSDIAMPTVAKVSEKLGLPHFISSVATDTCTDKYRMRTELGSAFAGNLPFTVASFPEDLLSFSKYPAVLKPTDSQGQRGVHKVRDFSDIRMLFEGSKMFSKTGHVILEKFVGGQEVSVNAYMHDGRMIFGIVSDRISFPEYPGGIIKEHHLPTSVNRITEKKVLDLAGRAAAKLGILEGPCYFQIRLMDNDPYLIETAPRLDGCHMWRLIRFYTGVDLLHITFCHLLTGQLNTDDFRSSKSSAPLRTVFMSQPPDTRVVTKPYPDSLFCQWYYDNGDLVRRTNGYMEKCGYRIERSL